MSPQFLSRLVMFVSIFQIYFVDAENKTTTVEPPPVLWQKSGFDAPESSLYDPKSKTLYVSNIQGHPNEADNKGYISRLTLEGDVVDKKWVTGLHAPKGMGLYKHLLYVADLQFIRVIDTRNGSLVSSIKIEQSKMLNDIAIDKQGNVFISDLLGGGIYQLSNNSISTLVSPEELPHTNGLYIDGQELIIATWGKNMSADFSTEILGSLYKLNLSTSAFDIVPGTENIGNLDGVAIFNDTIYVNDWMNGNMFCIKDGKVDLSFNTGKFSADIYISEGLLLVPIMFEHKVQAYQLAN